MSFHILSLLTDVLSTSYSTSPSHPPSTSPTFYIFFYLFFSLQSYFYIRYILLLFPRLSFFLKCVSSLSYLFVPFWWIIYSPSILVFAFFKKKILLIFIDFNSFIYILPTVFPRLLEQNVNRRRNRILL